MGTSPGDPTDGDLAAELSFILTRRAGVAKADAAVAVDAILAAAGTYRLNRHDDEACAPVEDWITRSLERVTELRSRSLLFEGPTCRCGHPLVTDRLCSDDPRSIPGERHDDCPYEVVFSDRFLHEVREQRRRLALALDEFIVWLTLQAPDKPGHRPTDSRRRDLDEEVGAALAAVGVGLTSAPGGVLARILGQVYYSVELETSPEAAAQRLCRAHPEWRAAGMETGLRT